MFPSQVLNNIADGTEQDLFVCVQHYLHKARFKILDGKTLDGRTMKESWWTYLSGLYKMTRSFERMRFLDTDNQQQHKTGLRLFNLVHISSFKQNHLLIDTSMLYELLSISRDTDKPRSEEI